MKKKYHIGFISSHYLFNGKKSNKETKALLKAASKTFSKVTIINPRNVYSIFNSKKKKTKIFHGTSEISKIDGIITRSTGKYEKSLEALVRALKSNGCVFLDSPERHNGESAGKMNSSIKRADKGVGITSFFSFSLKQSLLLINNINVNKNNPIVCKPVDGKKGKDVHIVTTKKRLKELARNHYHESDNHEKPFFLQSYIDIKEEYRVVVLGGRVLSSVLKIPSEGSVVSNAARGGKFIEKRNENLEDFVIQNVDPSGLYGVDVAITRKNKFYIIESNRAPLWHTFEKETGVNVANEIVAHFKTKIETAKKK